MQTSVTFKNLDSSDHLKSYVGDKLDRLDKYLDNPAEANVVLTVEKFRHIAEINIAGDRLSINGKEETNDMYSAIDMVLDKLEKQIKKNKQKIRERRTSGINNAEGVNFSVPRKSEMASLLKQRTMNHSMSKDYNFCKLGCKVVVLSNLSLLLTEKKQP